MKMNQKGIAIAVIAVIVVVVVVVAVAGVFLLTRGGGGVGGLPVYSGASKSATAGAMGSAGNFVKAGVGKENYGSVSDVPSGCQSELYTASAGTSVSDILNWYKTEMANQGWTKLYEESYSYDYMGTSVLWGLLYFDKEDRTAAVVAANYAGEVYFAMVEGPETIFDSWMGSAGYEWTEPTVGPTGGIGSATSLSFKVDSTMGGYSLSYTFKAKNIGSEHLKLRIDGTAMDQSVVYIVNGETQQAWMSSGDQWTDLSSTYSTQWSTWSQSFGSYQESLSGWTGGTYTSPDGSVTISDIQVNPTLDDSLFVH